MCSDSWGLAPWRDASARGRRVLPNIGNAALITLIYIITLEKRLVFLELLQKTNTEWI